MSAGYVPQVGDRVRRPEWLSDEWLDVKAVVEAECRLGGPIYNGVWVWHMAGGVWVKVDKPEPWPVGYIALRRTSLGLELVAEFTTLGVATARCAEWFRCTVPPADLRIWRSNPDGSVTVLDHAGAET